MLKNMKIRVLVWLLLLAACSLRKQHFVFVLVDDLGWRDLGYSGSTFYETPHLDAFSQQAIHFTSAYAAASVCSPSRAAIFTGKHPARLRITDWITGANYPGQLLQTPEILNELPLQEQTFAEVLRQNGYRTFFAGKWHLGGEGFLPQQQGFDINLGGHDKGSPPGVYYAPYQNPQLPDGPEGEYLPDRLTSEAIGFLQRKADRPFLLFLSFYTVHTPIQPARRHLRHF